MSAAPSITDPVNSHADQVDFMRRLVIEWFVSKSKDGSWDTAYFDVDEENIATVDGTFAMGDLADFLVRRIQGDNKPN